MKQAAISNKTRSNNRSSVVRTSYKIQTFENIYLRETFEIDCSVSLTITSTQPNRSVQRDEKHHQ
jgi:hypothetical protein